MATLSLWGTWVGTGRGMKQDCEGMERGGGAGTQTEGWRGSGEGERRGVWQAWRKRRVWSLQTCTPAALSPCLHAPPGPQTFFHLTTGNEVTDDGLAKAFNKYTSFAKAKVGR